jgi:hypothetical protein
LTLADADRLVNRFCALFLRTFPGLVWKQAKLSSGIYGHDFVGTPPGAAIRTTMGAKLAALRYVGNGQGQGLPGLASTAMVRRNADMLASHEAFTESRYLALVKQLTDLRLACAIFALLGICFILGLLDVKLVALSVAVSVTVAFYVSVISVLLVQLPRYELPYELLLALLTSVLVSALSNAHKGFMFSAALRCNGTNRFRRVLSKPSRRFDRVK